MRKVISIVIISLFVAGVAAIADAVVLDPGDSGIPPLHAAPPAATFLTSLSGSYVSQYGNYSGTYLQNVLKNNVTGNILFEYILTLDSTSKTAVAALGASFFGGFATDVDAVSTVNPHVDALSRYPDGETVVFSYLDDNIKPGQSSNILWIQTDAPWYDNGGLFSTLGADTVTVQVYKPSRTTPEPASAALLGMGLLGIAGAVRRKFIA